MGGGGGGIKLDLVVFSTIVTKFGVLIEFDKFSPESPKMFTKMANSRPN